MSEFALKGAELKKMLGTAKKQPVSFGFNPGRNGEGELLAMHKTKPAKTLGRAAKDEGAGSLFAYGTAQVSQGTLTLQCEREIPQLAKAMKRYLKSQNVTLNVEVLDA